MIKHFKRYMVGLGNALSAFCYYYVQCAQSKEPFNFVQIMKHIKWKSKGVQILSLFKKNSLLKYLPLQTNFSEKTLKIDESIDFYENVHTCELFFHLRRFGILENLHIIRPILYQAIEQYHPEQFSFHSNDVVIHLRTGDIFSNKHTEFYSGIHFENYKQILQSKCINKIYIIWKSDRPQDKKFEKYNIALLNALKSYLSENLGLQMSSIISDHLHSDDFVFMIQSPFLIASISTYSMWAALLNSYNAIIPRCKNHFNNTDFIGDSFQFQQFRTINKFESDIHLFCNQFIY